MADQPDKIPHSRPDFAESDRLALAEVLADGFVTSGPRAARFGAAMAVRLGRGWGIAVQSGTDALTAALKLLDLPAGAKVAVPAYGCTAPLDAIALLGLVPEPIDIARQPLAMAPEAINARTDCAAVIAAHLFGLPAPLGEIRHPALIEDCAQTLPDPAAGVKVGCHGRFTICSGYGTKLLATGHGGVLAGDDSADFARAMDCFHHDQRDAWHPHLHFLMSDLNAALGLSQLSRLDQFLAVRRRLAARFSQALGTTGPLPASAYSRFIVEVLAPEDFNEITASFAAAGIEAKRPVHLPIYRALGRSDNEFPVAAWATARLLSIPLYSAMTEAETVRIETSLEQHRHDLRRWPSA